jgi:hypothetical protein
VPGDFIDTDTDCNSDGKCHSNSDANNNGNHDANGDAKANAPGGHSTASDSAGSTLTEPR